jgi:hypothetical protein
MAHFPNRRRASSRRAWAGPRRAGPRPLHGWLRPESCPRPPGRLGGVGSGPARSGALWSMHQELNQLHRMPRRQRLVQLVAFLVRALESLRRRPVHGRSIGGHHVQHAPCPRVPRRAQPAGRGEADRDKPHCGLRAGAHGPVAESGAAAWPPHQDPDPAAAGGARSVHRAAVGASASPEGRGRLTGHAWHGLQALRLP